MLHLLLVTATSVSTKTSLKGVILEPKRQDSVDGQAACLLFMPLRLPGHQHVASQVLAVAGDTLNKAGEAVMQPQVQVPKNYQAPKNIRSYAQYLKAAGQATGILPIQPEADSPSVAPGPSSGTAQTPEAHAGLLAC